MKSGVKVDTGHPNEEFLRRIREPAVSRRIEDLKPVARSDRDASSDPVERRGARSSARDETYESRRAYSAFDDVAAGDAAGDFH